MAQAHILTQIPANWSDPVLTRQQAEALLSQPHHVLLAINGEGGHLLASLMPHMPADILTLYVPPAHRRNGHARTLVEAAIAAARKAACTGLTLEVEASNAAAINLYRACGLQQVALRAGYYYNPVSNLKADALVLALPLA